MWYRATLSVADAGTTPIRADQITQEGPCLEELVVLVAMRLVEAFDQTRPSDHRFLRGLLEVGLEIEQWTSQTDLLRHDGEAEDFRLAMRACVMRSQCSGRT